MCWVQRSGARTKGLLGLEGLKGWREAKCVELYCVGLEIWRNGSPELKGSIPVGGGNVG